MKEQKQPGSLPWFGIPKLLPYLRPYRRMITLMLILGFYGSAMDAVYPLFQRYAINHFIAGSTLDTLWWFIGLYAMAIATQTTADYISAFGAIKLEMFMDRDLRREAFNHLQTLSFSYFNQNSVGYIHARVMSDTDRISGTLAWDMMDGVWNLSYLLGAICVMLARGAIISAIVSIVFLPALRTCTERKRSLAS